MRARATTVPDEPLLALLRAVRDHEEDAEQLDSAGLARCLGWTRKLTASSLATAKDELLVWGIRVGGDPAPCFDEIELTVQGRRALDAFDASRG